MSFQAVDFQNAGFWRLKAPETSIWAPEGAFGPKKAIFHNLFDIFWPFFPHIWPLAGSNIAEKGWPLLGKALERVWEGFEKAQLSSRDQVGC